MPQNYLLVITTVATFSQARKVADTLVKEYLAGCVQITGPITSFYRWTGKVQRSREWLCFIKTSRKIYPRLEKRLKQIHSYQVPEIIAFSIKAGERNYLSWLSSCLSATKRGKK